MQQELHWDCTDYVVTDAPICVKLRNPASGSSWGTIDNPDSLLRAAEVLINRAEAEATQSLSASLMTLIALPYNSIDGVKELIPSLQNVISHLVVRTFKSPAPPALSPLPIDPHLSPAQLLRNWVTPSYPAFSSV